MERNTLISCTVLNAKVKKIEKGFNNNVLLSDLSTLLRSRVIFLAGLLLEKKDIMARLERPRGLK